MADKKKIELTKRDRFNVMWHSQFLQGSWNYERMQNGGLRLLNDSCFEKVIPRQERFVCCYAKTLSIL